MNTTSVNVPIDNWTAYCVFFYTFWHFSLRSTPSSPLLFLLVHQEIGKRKDCSCYTSHTHKRRIAVHRNDYYIHYTILIVVAFAVLFCFSYSMSSLPLSISLQKTPFCAQTTHYYSHETVIYCRKKNEKVHRKFCVYLLQRYRTTMGNNLSSSPRSSKNEETMFAHDVRTTAWPVCVCSNSNRLVE